MESPKIIYKETAIVALGEGIGVGLMLAVFALLGYFDLTVLLGGLMGGILALGNFFLMSYFAVKAAGKAQNQDVKGGKSTMQFSYFFRLILMFAALAVCAKSGLMNLLALVIPILLVRPIIMFAEFFRRKGGTQT